MKTKTLNKVIVLSLITATTLQATNGDHLIGIGAKARGMGGAGIAMSHGAESALSNPALITQVEGNEISFGGTVFMPDIETTLNANPNALPPQDSHKSNADLSMIPEVSLATKVNENFYVGIGMWGTGGMGTDYSKDAGIEKSLGQGQFNNFDMVTNLQMMQFAIPLAYKVENFSIAVTPILMYGNLDINFKMPSRTDEGTVNNIGSGIAQDFGYGYNIGTTYDFSNGLTLGAVYKSAIEMNYDHTIKNAAQNFGLQMTDTLEQPAEIGVGIAYAMNQHTIAFDYKKIKWSDAKGYSDVLWEDQNVYAVGYQFAQDDWALRVGYNQADSAVVETKNPAINMFNLLGFPATAEKHYTVGGTYAVNEQLTVDLAYVYADKSTKTFDISQLKMGMDSITTEHSENSVSFQLNYTF
ncbi:MAG: porin [Sulfurovum sp.]|nr:porin [Sulfurovum sp.]